MHPLQGSLLVVERKHTKGNRFGGVLFGKEMILSVCHCPTKICSNHSEDGINLRFPLLSPSVRDYCRARTAHPFHQLHTKTSGARFASSLRDPLVWNCMASSYDLVSNSWYTLNTSPTALWLGRNERSYLRKEFSFHTKNVHTQREVHRPCPIPPQTALLSKPGASVPNLLKDPT